MIYQNDKDCLTVIQKVGCFVRSCGLLAELKTKEELTAEQINRLWTWGKDVNYINQDNCLVNSAALATYALRMLGDNTGKFIEIGTKENGKENLYKWAVKFNYKPEFFIQKIIQGGPSKTHFRVVDKDDNLIVDPHSPAIKMIRPVYTILYSYQ